MLDAINRAGGDEVHLVLASPEALHFEVRSSDAYSCGITDLAFDLIEPVFIQVPMVLTSAYLRVCNELPNHVTQYSDDGVAFEFFTVHYRSTGGPVHVHLYGSGRTAIDNGVEVHRPEGYVIAADLVIRDEPPLSGTVSVRNRPARRSGAPN